MINYKLKNERKIQKLRTKYLTGIKPTDNEIHLGNFIGSIKPVIELLENEENIDIYFFIADYHALTSQPNSEKLKENIKNMLLSCASVFFPFLDKCIKNNNSLYLYRQSKIPEIFELNWLLSCFTAKGLLNRNHSYKQETEKNMKKGKDMDAGIFAGLYNYPILMASDIILFGTDYVPVGKDQIQHIEITNDIIDKINHLYGNVFKNVGYINNKEFLLMGKDGQKMSKSYGNTISLFANEKDLKRYIYSFKTNCKEYGESKYPEDSYISNLYKLFSTEEEYFKFVRKMKDGLDWKTLKDDTFDLINEKILKYRNSYNFYKDKKSEIENLFKREEKLLSFFANNNLKYVKQIIGMEVK